ncbi:MAG: cytochrome c3 family protein [Planctomycetota bacterium]
MTRRTVWIIFVVSCMMGGAAILASSNVRLPGNDIGYVPEQPIAFSHRLHAGELAISCLYCHSGAEQSRHAGIPAVSVCMNCHLTVKAPMAEVKAEAAAATAEGRDPRRIVSPEIQKIYDAMGLDKDLKRDPKRPAPGISWIKVHDLPDFVYFNHGRHVNAGVDCTACHGPVATMDRVRQESNLSMGFCVNCHRDVNENGLAGDHSLHASTDCAGCHY